MTERILCSKRSQADADAAIGDPTSRFVDTSHEAGRPDYGLLDRDVAPDGGPVDPG